MRHFTLMAVALFLGATLGCCRGLRPTLSLPPAPILESQRLSTPHVVLVESGSSVGTGWVLSDNLIVTCRHVVVNKMDFITPHGHFQTEEVEQFPSVMLTDGTQLRCVVMGVSECYDVAVLYVYPRAGDPMDPMPVCHDPLWWGESAEAWGYPDGEGPYVTTGLIDGPHWDGVHVDTTISCKPGSSGSPVVNIEGAVIGMVQMAYVNSERAIILPGQALRDGIREAMHK